MRPSVALAAVGLTAALLVGLVAVGGFSAGDPVALDAELTDEAPRRFVPAEVDDSQLLLVTSADDGAWEIDWEPQTGNADNPAFGIVLPRAERNQRGPQIDTSGVYTSRLACDDECTIDIGLSADRRAVLDTVPGEAAAWHATSPESIAWSSSTADGVVLSLGLVAEDGIEFSQAIPTDGLADGDIVRWYDVHGVVTAGSEVRALSTRGDVLWAATGRLVDITTQTAMIIEDPGFWRLVDRITGETIAISGPDADAIFLDIAQATPTLSTSSGASWAYQFSVEDGGSGEGNVRLPLFAGPGSEMRMTRDADGSLFTLSFTFADDG